MSSYSWKWTREKKEVQKEKPREKLFLDPRNLCIQIHKECVEKRKEKKGNFGNGSKNEQEGKQKANKEMGNKEDQVERIHDSY